MKLLKRCGLVGVGVTVLFGLMTFVGAKIWPDLAAQRILTAYAMSAGLEKKVIKTDSGDIHYFEAGEGEQTVVLLHGIFASKEHWIDFSREISDQYHIIIPDIPGFGDNDSLSENGYRYDHQVIKLKAFLDEIAPEPVHLAGNSMGGQLAGLLAVTWPDHFLSVSFIGSPVGIDTPSKSAFEIQMAEAEYSLVVANAVDFETRNGLLFHKTPFTPAVVEQYVANQEISKYQTNLRIWSEVNASNTRPLSDIAEQIEHPSHLIWCMEDQIFDFSGAQVLIEALPDGNLTTLDECGHIPNLEKPRVSGRAYRHFIDSL